MVDSGNVTKLLDLLLFNLEIELMLKQWIVVYLHWVLHMIVEMNPLTAFTVNDKSGYGKYLKIEKDVIITGRSGKFQLPKIIKLN